MKATYIVLGIVAALGPQHLPGQGRRFATGLSTAIEQEFRSRTGMMSVWTYPFRGLFGDSSAFQVRAGVGIGVAPDDRLVATSHSPD